MNRLFAFALCCAVAFSLTARDVYVAIGDPNAADDEAVGRGGVDLPYWSIQAAVNAADTNDTVLVKPGYYTNNYAISSTSYLPGRQRNRVVLTKNLTLRSTEGKEKTFIVGHWRDGADVNDSTWNPGASPFVVGIHAVRCVFVEPEASGSIIKGFTLTHGATDNSVAASDAGGGFAAPGGGYLVDCEISHCAGYGAAAVYGGTLVRCVSKDFWPYSGSGLHL